MSFTYGQYIIIVRDYIYIALKNGRIIAIAECEPELLARLAEKSERL